MSSDIPDSKSEACAEPNRKKRKNLLEDFVSIDRQTPSKRMTRSATATPAKIQTDRDDLLLKETKPKETRKQPRLILSPKKSVSQIPEFPQRLMPQKNIPSTGKINSYSKTEYLVNIAGVLRNTKYLDALIKSPIGSLFNLRSSRAALSGKLTHHILCRMLPTRKQHELWFVFSNRPIRFSLKEFATVTGLPCGQYPTDSYFAECRTLADTNDHPNAYWNELMVGCIKGGIIKDIANLLWDDPKLPEEELRIYRDERAKLSLKKKMRLCLVLLVDGVICPRSSAKTVSKFTVELVKNITMFLKYPWGRESFTLTIDAVKTISQSTKSIEATIKKLKRQTHVLLKGLSIAFQLLFFAAVPALDEFNPDAGDEDDLHVAHPDLEGLDTNLRFTNSEILKIDNDPKTQVISFVGKGYDNNDGYLSWIDEVNDPLVDNMVNCIAKGFDFKNVNWSNETFVDPNNPGTMKTAKTRKSRRTQSAKKPVPKETIIQIDDDDQTWQYNPNDLIDRYCHDLLRKQTDEYIRLIEGRFWKNVKAMSSQIRADNKFYIEVEEEKPDNNVRATGSDTESNNHDSEDTSKVGGKEKPIVEKSEQRDEDSESDDEWLQEQNVGSDKLYEWSSGANPAVQDTVRPNDTGTSGGTILSGSPEPVETTDVSAEQAPIPFTKPGAEIHSIAEKKTMTEVLGEETTESPNPDLAALMDSEDDDMFPETNVPQSKEDIVGLKQDNAEVVSPVEQSEPAAGKPEERISTNIDVEDIYVTKQPRGEQMQTDSKWTGSEFLLTGENNQGEESTDTVKDVVKAINLQHSTNDHGFIRPDESKISAFLSAVDTYRKSEYLIYNISVPRGIFRQIAAPTIHLSTNHMELMIGSVWDRLGKEISGNRAVILGTALCHFLKVDAANYKEKRGNPFVWDKNLVNMVNGTFFQREGSTAWMRDVDRVYAPMNWVDKHWVGLCIELVTGTVTVFDSSINLVKPEKADEIMYPIIEILPLMISDLTAGNGSAYTPPAVFVYERPEDVPQNSRGGDCGPLAVKFMELHSQGILFPTITDKMVDNMRMNYSLDIFQRFVTPPV